MCYTFTRAQKKKQRWSIGARSSARREHTNNSIEWHKKEAIIHLLSVCRTTFGHTYLAYLHGIRKRKLKRSEITNELRADSMICSMCVGLFSTPFSRRSFYFFLPSLHEHTIQIWIGIICNFAHYLLSLLYEVWFLFNTRPAIKYILARWLIYRPQQKIETFS